MIEAMIALQKLGETRRIDRPPAAAKSKAYLNVERWCLERAEAFFWRENIGYDVMESSFSYPEDQAFSDDQMLSEVPQFHWFEKPVTFFYKHANGTDAWVDISSVLIGSNDGTLFCAYTERTDIGYHDILPFITTGLTRGEAVNKLDEGRTQDPEAPNPVAMNQLMKRWLKWALSAQAWMRHRLVGISSVTPSRGMRREAARNEEELSPLNLVTLRAKDYEREQSDDPEAVDWSHRWWVRPHWRNDPRYPNPIPIRGHVKGPPDKPLILKTTVFDARR